MSATRRLADYAVSARFEDIPEVVLHEARRALVDCLGCAMGGAHDEAVDTALRTFGAFSGPRTAVVIGRPERMDPLHASLINGISAHVEDYDDATPKNYVHATAPIAATLFSHASANKVSGRDFLAAFVLGFEATSRVGNAVHPAHYDAGWHITSTAGVFGAATAIGRLTGLDPQRMTTALGLAATQASGLREMFGSMAKPFHVGRAAQSGYGAALLAREGFTAAPSGIEGARGFAAVLSARYDLNRITDGLGEAFDLTGNTYKPFPCGLVNHTTIDACIALREAPSFKVENIKSVRLQVAPLVIELCDKKDIRTGLEGKFSIYHSAAVALARGKAGLAEYTDHAVNDPVVRELRKRVVAVVDTSLAKTGGARVEVDMADGSTLRQQTTHSPGSLARPLSDEQLGEKFLEQAETILSAGEAKTLLRQCWMIDQLAEIAPLVAATVPRPR